ncbi:retrovirus-related pol polyprotein from transposon TNT 1-94 [Tanacetum coccineum]
MYNNKKVDYAYLLWEDFIYQIENKNTKKGNAMYYPRFTKLIVNFVMAKDPSIPQRNKVNWHYARDDPMFTTINVITRNEDTQLYGTILPAELTNEDIRNSESYKEYYAIASGKIPPKTKARVPDAPNYDSDDDISWKSSQDDEDDDKNNNDKNAQDDDDEAQTESRLIDNEVEGMDVEGAKSDEDATYVEDQGNEAVEDTNANLEGRDDVMTDVILPQTKALEDNVLGTQYKTINMLNTLLTIPGIILLVITVTSLNKKPRDGADNDRRTSPLNRPGSQKRSQEKNLNLPVLLRYDTHDTGKLLQGRHVIPFHHFINNDLEYLRGGESSRKYSTSVTKTTAADYGHIKWIEDLVPNSMWSQMIVKYDKFALWGISHWGKKRRQFYAFGPTRESARDVYSKRRIIAVTKVEIVEWQNYKHLDWITIYILYKFKEGDFHRLRIQDIEDMLLLLVQGKVTNLNVEERTIILMDFEGNLRRLRYSDTAPSVTNDKVIKLKNLRKMQHTAFQSAIKKGKRMSPESQVTRWHKLQDGRKEIFLEKDLKIAKNKKEKYKSLALKARKVLSDDDASSSDNNDEEYAMAVRDFKKFFRRRGNDQKAFVVGKLERYGDDSRERRDLSQAHLNKIRSNSLKLKLVSFESSSSSLQKMVEMQKPSKDKYGLGYTGTIASPRNTKIKNLGDHLKKLFVESAGRCHSSTTPACSIEQHQVSDDSAETPGIYHGREFDNEVKFGAFCDANGITHNFLAPRTPQSNGVVEHDDILENDIIENQDKDLEIKENEPLNKEITNIKSSKDHPLGTVIENLNERTLRSHVQNQSNFFCFVSSVEPKNIKEAIQDESWTMAMQEELNQFKTNDVWSLVPPPKNQIIIELCDDFSKIMHDEFEMSMMGELNFFLGLQIKQLEDGIFFNQSKYVKEMLKKFGLENSKPIKTPMSSETKLTRDEDGESIDDTKYRGMIGSLLYLTASRPDIMFSVCLCARFQEAPKTSHLEAVKRIFRYIKGTSHLGLWYPKGTGLETIVYADSDHAGDYVDRKSTSGVCTFMGCCLTSWFSKKQTALAISTTEAEYVSAEKACQQALWMKQALVDYDIKLDDIPVLCDNKGAIDLSKNPVLHSRTKHIEIRHHFLRDNVQKGNITIEKVASEDNIADILTKPLKREPFNLLRLGLGLMEPNA